MDSMTTFRLLDLPVELRIMIYEYTFGDSAPQDLDLLNIQAHYPPSDLLHTSQQIYEEAHQTYKQATQRFLQSKTYYLKISHNCMSEDYMKQLCRRLSQHRFKIQQTVTIRFVGLDGYRLDEYARLDLSLNARGALVTGVQNVPNQVYKIATRFKRIRTLPLGSIRSREGGLDSRAVVVYLSAILQHEPRLGEMWGMGE